MMDGYRGCKWKEDYVVHTALPRVLNSSVILCDAMVFGSGGSRFSTTDK
jgi:hypothetical protein